jgi:antitoxin (DNA-binding transcriptional repressor) of toxin-antitoxin stability system
MKTISISRLRTDFDRVVAEAGRSRAPVVITYRGRPVARVRLAGGHTLARSLPKSTASGKTAKRVARKR